MSHYAVHACTDITGFGLLGHLADMVVGSGCGLRVYSRQVPILPETADLAKMGIIPAGAHRNKEFRTQMIDFDPSVERHLQDILFDPQTSGGLLISVDQADASRLLSDLIATGEQAAALIGEVTTGPDERIVVV
jgi:selenide,water dikinase